MVIKIGIIILIIIEVILILQLGYNIYTYINNKLHGTFGLYCAWAYNCVCEVKYCNCVYEDIDGEISIRCNNPDAIE